jgi:hypothetical protein
MDTVHNAGFMALIGKRHEENPTMPKRQDHLLVPFPTGEQLFTTTILSPYSQPQRPQRAESQCRPPADFEFLE